jgi:hypothetical protein
MTISRMGISTLMGYANGGDINEDTNISPDAMKIIQQMIESDDNQNDMSFQFKQYSDLLSGMQPPRPPATGFDLASSLGKGILAEQANKFPSLGRGLGLGFQDFNKLQKEIEDENRKAKQARDLTAFGLVTKKKSDPSAKIGALWKDPAGNFFRELIVGDQIVYKGEGLVMTEAEFNNQFPEARPTVASEEQRYQMDINKFFDYEKQMREQEQSLEKLISYMKNRGGAPQGYDYFATRAQTLINTFMDKENINSEQLMAGLAEGKFQGLIGRFRVETVGPGVMTEFDAQRIIMALGGEPGALQNKVIAAAILRDIFTSKYQLYLDAARKYNAGVASGEFDESYKRHEIRKEGQGENDFDTSVFTFELTMPPGANLIEEKKNAAGETISIVYEDRGKKYEKFPNGVVEEIKDEIYDNLDDIIPD